MERLRWMKRLCLAAKVKHFGVHTLRHLSESILVENDIPLIDIKTGELIYDKRIAKKLLAAMQGDYENGVFRIEKYIGHGWTDTVPYLYEWLEVVKGDFSSATYKDYSNSIRNPLKPFLLKIHFNCMKFNMIFFVNF